LTVYWVSFRLVLESFSSKINVFSGLGLEGSWVKTDACTPLRIDLAPSFCNMLTGDFTADRDVWEALDRRCWSGLDLEGGALYFVFILFTSVPPI
jgi:hypothetical protein